MPPLYANVRIVLRGTISANQSWSTGITYRPADVNVDQAQLQTFATSVKDLANNWWQSSGGVTGGTAIRQHNASDTVLRGVTCYLRGPAGSAILQAASDIGSTGAAGSSTEYGPTQACLVATTLTGLSGRSYRGRNYLPATAPLLQADHQISQNDCQSLATAFAALLGGINDLPLGGAQGVVVVGSTQPPGSPITQVRIDSEIDIQRRRADKLTGIRRSTQTLP